AIFVSAKAEGSARLNLSYPVLSLIFLVLPTSLFVDRVSVERYSGQSFLFTVFYKKGSARKAR
uniref:hypothetical protein n=1 Tax=Vibrio lentus TaxID=136468 RepID=UPI001E5E0378